MTAVSRKARPQIDSNKTLLTCQQIYNNAQQCKKNSQCKENIWSTVIKVRLTGC